MTTAGSHSRQKRTRERTSGDSSLTKSRLRSKFWALARVPTSSGPAWCGRFLPSRSPPSGLKFGANTSTRSLSSGASLPRARSRANIMRASLPSTSPAWMLPKARTTNLPLALASAAVDGQVGEDDQGELAPLVADAHLAQAHARGEAGELGAEVEHIGVARGGGEVALLRHGVQALGEGGGGRQQPQEQGTEQTTGPG